MKFQWTRLSDGIPTAQFVERVKRLTEKPLAAAEEATGARAFAQAVPTGPSGGKAVPGWVWGLGAGFVVAVAAFLITHRKAEPPAAPEAKVEAKPAEPTAEAAVESKVSEKSIAVLPFANMSDEKDNAFFTDGIQEDILTNLALVHELRVVSRTSVQRYRDTTKPITQIASELGVAYILEGSVRRAGNKVRVTGQLIQAATDQHVWAKAYDRDMTDIFAIQSELSQAIASELKAALSPEEKAQLDRQPTQNTAAYDLYLRARSMDSLSDLHKQEQILEQAVAMDPSFARAWADLADEYAEDAFEQHEGMDALLAKSKAAIDKAVQLAPDDPEVISSLGTFYYYGYRDYAKANEQYQRIARLRPNDASVDNSLALILRRQGKWAESLEHSRRAVALDVANARYLNNHIATLVEARRYDELAEAWKRMAALKPERWEIPFQVAIVAFHATGSTKEAEAFIAHMTPEQRVSSEGMDLLTNWATTTGNYAEAARLQKIQRYTTSQELEPWEQDVISALTFVYAGDKAGAIERLGHIPEDNIKRLEREPNNARCWTFQAIILLCQGKTDEGVRASDRSLEIMSKTQDALDLGIYKGFHFMNLAATGDSDRAIAELAKLVRLPGAQGTINVNELRRAPWPKLQADPRFKALLDDPLSNAPLF